MKVIFEAGEVSQTGRFKNEFLRDACAGAQVVLLEEPDGRYAVLKDRARAMPPEALPTQAAAEWVFGCSLASAPHMTEQRLQQLSAMATGLMAVEQVTAARAVNELVAEVRELNKANAKLEQTITRLQDRVLEDGGE